ncbi:hypothetical protein HYU16_05270 [Candidatus Woesearchaeota archaeon]|nr:hypothetical protein [Candidatus Woesearchaeota archaeon]
MTKEEREKRASATGRIIIVTAIVLSLAGTFLVANTITGFTVAKESVTKGDFAAVAGKAADEGISPAQLDGLQKAAGSALLGLLSIAMLVVVARIGQGALAGMKESKTPGIKGTVEKAENAIKEGNHPEAYALYSSIKQIYAQMEEDEKAQYYSRIMHIHKALAQQAAMTEAHYLTEKYLNGTITESEFERLKHIIASQ